MLNKGIVAILCGLTALMSAGAFLWMPTPTVSCLIPAVAFGATLGWLLARAYVRRWVEHQRAIRLPGVGQEASAKRMRVARSMAVVVVANVILYLAVTSSVQWFAATYYRGQAWTLGLGEFIYQTEWLLLILVPLTSLVCLAMWRSGYLAGSDKQSLTRSS